MRIRMSCLSAVYSFILSYLPHLLLNLSTTRKTHILLLLFIFFLILCAWMITSTKYFPNRLTKRKQYDDSTEKFHNQITVFSGKMCSLIGFVETLIPVIYIPLYSKLFSNTVETFPGAVYILGGTMTVPAFIIFMWVPALNRRRLFFRIASP